MAKQIEVPKHSDQMANWQGREGTPPTSPQQTLKPVPPVEQVVNGRTIRGE